MNEKEEQHSVTPEEFRKLLVSTCASLGASRMEIYFDGSGDSGQVEGVTLYNAQNQVVDIPKGMKVQYPRRHQTFGRDGWKKHFTTETLPLSEALQEWAYDILADHCPGDWVNDAGGYGFIRADFTPPYNFKLEYHQRIETTEDYDIELFTDEQEGAE